MISKFLSAKHWQLFLLLFGIPFIFQMFMMMQMVASFSSSFDPNNGPPDIPAFSTYFILTFAVSVFYMALFYGWIWSIGMGLQSKIPQEINMKTGRFKFALIYPIIYMSLFLCLAFFITTLLASMSSGILAIIIPLHLLTMVCIFYCLYFVAKTIKTAELKKELRFSDFVGEFFLIWFYPIGIWFLQPRINAIHASETDQGIEEHLVG